MKRTLVVLLAATLLLGCSKSASSPPTQPPASTPAPQPAPKQGGSAPATPSGTAPDQSAHTPTPATPTLVEGPIYLLARPEKPLWPGPSTVVVENSSQSRPQIGLGEADLVIEALAESEITRFLAFYWSRPVSRIGPVRSARLYAVAIADVYRAPFAHSGGNNDALLMLKRAGKPHNLDEIYGSGQYFVRSDARRPPHNLYTSTELLDRAVRERSIPMGEVPTSPRAPAAAPESGAVSGVEVNWHSLHQVAWRLEGGAYKRFEHGEAPHTLEDGAQISVPNLLFLQVEGVNNGPDLGWDLDLEKGGKATVLSQGRKWEGSWSFGASGFSVSPAEGKVPLLAPGQVWVHLITRESGFKVAP